MVLIHHPLGFNQKLLEDAGIISCFGTSPLLIDHPLFLYIIDHHRGIDILYLPFAVSVFSHIGFLSPLRNLGSVRIPGLNIYHPSRQSAQQAQPPGIAPEK